MSTNAKLNLLVMFGGMSPEHEVSVITALQVCENSAREKYNVVPLYIAKNGTWHTGDFLLKAENYKQLDDIPAKTDSAWFSTAYPKLLFSKSSKPLAKEVKTHIDVVFLAFHGGSGENGEIQGLLEIMDIPYVGSNVLGSTLGMDKVVMKEVLTHAGIKVAPYMFFYKGDWLTNKDDLMAKLEHDFTYPLFVKPANSGSSIGITKVTDKNSLENAIEVALKFDHKIIIEQGILNHKEINTSVIGLPGYEPEVSECEEVFAKSDFLNYEDKYVGSGGKSKGMASTERKIPADISKELRNKIQETAKKAFSVLNAGGLARIDFLVNPETSECTVIEINTIPGSMSFYLWEATKLPFAEMVDKLVTLALKAHADKKEKTTTFSSNILKDFKPSLKSPKLV